MSEFAGKAALVTGAAGGIGRATAERLERGGADVIRVDREQADVSDAKQVAKLFEGLGGLDVLVNAPASSATARSTRPTERCWDEVMDVNLKAAFLCSPAAIPLLRAAAAARS